MTLLPQPRHLETQNGQNPLPQKWKPSLAFQPSEQFERALKTVSILEYNELSTPSLSLHIDTALKHPQEYRITATATRASITGQSEQALYLALATFTQILAKDNLAQIEIHDWPDIQHRGYMLDISRCKVPTIEALLSLIDDLASLKYTQLQLYTEHTFAYQAHKTVWENASPLTATEIQQLDAYCRDRYIELVPNQNSFGHMERWLRHDAYKHLAESPDGFQYFGKWRDHGGTLKPNTESIEFIKSLYDELLPNFTSKSFNVGCDETWELGQGFSKPQAEAIGKRKVYLEHLTQIANEVESRGYQMMFWGDIILEQPELVPELPKNLVPIIWGYESDHPFEEQCQIFKNAGLPFYIAPGTWTWNTLSGRTQNARINNERAAKAAIEYGAEGLLLTDWGDDGHHQSHLFSLPSLLRTASLAWNHQTENLESQIEQTQLPSPIKLKTLLDFGKIHEPLGPEIHNTTRLNKTLFAKQNSLPEILEGVDPMSIDQTSKALDAIQSTLDTELPDEAADIRSELQVTLDLLRFALLKAERHLARRPINTPQTFANLASIASRFEKNWLRRNRPGGLPESLSNLLRPNRPD